MKAKLFLPIFALMLVVGLRIQAQGTFFTSLYTFTNGTDGGFPYGSVVLLGNTLCGTAVSGGTNDNGTIFAINTDGTEFADLHSFSTRAGNNNTNADGAYPYGGLILSCNTFYGMAYGGGTNGSGTVYAVNTDGTGFTVLYAFSTLANNTNGDGAHPYDSLILSGNTLYGTAVAGGTNGNGTVFALNTNGTGFTVLHSFSALANNTNDDGAYPYDGLILSGNTLYGTAEAGGTNGNGTVFALNTNGTGFTVLHSFSARIGNNNNDGAYPYGSLVLSGNALYGTADGGGTNGHGIVFAVNTDGTGFADLHSFSTVAGNNGTNVDGANPEAGLLLSGNTLYGTAVAGGTNGHGTVFAVNTDGTGFAVLHNFIGRDGANPEASLVLSVNTLYGTTQQGGVDDYGTVFSLAPPPFIPLLNVVSLGNQVVILYPLTGTNFMLQTTTNLASGTWVNVTNGVPLVAVGITNSVPAAFFRLH